MTFKPKRPSAEGRRRLNAMFPNLPGPPDAETQFPELLSATAAASYLGMNRSSIYRYRKRGYLTPVLVEGAMRFTRDEVQELEERTRRGRIVRPSPQRCALLHAEIKELEDQIGDVDFILESTRLPLAVTDSEAGSLYRSAKNIIVNGWPGDSEKQWCQYLLRLGPADISQIERVLDVTDAWEPFLESAKVMAAKVVGTRLEPIFWVARANVVRVACKCIELKEGKGALRSTLHDIADIDTNQMRRTARINAKGDRRASKLSPADDPMRVALREFKEILAAKKNQLPTEQTGSAHDDL